MLLVVEQVADVAFGVVEVGCPEQGVEGADVDADPAVHAQREVDVEPVEYVDLAGPRRALLLHGLLVGVDVDAPVGAFAGAQHARGAVGLVQRDDTAGAFGQLGPVLGVLAGDRAARGRARGGGESAEEAAPGYRHAPIVSDVTEVFQPRQADRVQT
ncbi:hypothetical protein GCM10029992_22720 [Glycomyces albus]